MNIFGAVDPCLSTQWYYDDIVSVSNFRMSQKSIQSPFIINSISTTVYE